MLNIVKSLLFRLKKSSMFWIMLGVCAFFPALTALLNQFIVELAEIFIQTPIDMGLEMVTYMSLTGLAYLSSDINLFALLCVSIFLCKEFNDGTIRNALLSNKSRFALYGSYGIVSLIIGGSFLMANFASTLLVLGIPFGFGDVTANQAVTSCLCSLLLGLLSLIFVVSCVLMFLFATGKQAASIVLPILITIFLPGIISSIIDLVTTLLLLIQTGNPDAVFNTDYSWVPLYNANLYDSSNVDGGLVAKISLYYVVFGALFVFLGGLAAVKKDLK